MCGFAGLLHPGLTGRAAELEETALAMSRSLAHRGPDDEGVWCDPSAGYAVGFRRLAVVDLSGTGRQPMSSPSGRFLIAYNGEVYNHPDIRRHLESDHGVSFRGRSDTEVILGAIEEWGLERALDRFVGMFAFALWDRREHAVTLVRDRLGVKPLYYGISRGTLLFGSELRALRKYTGFECQLDPHAIAGYFHYGYIPGPASIFCGVRKLEPGSFVTISSDSMTLPEPRRYWRVEDVARAGLESRLTDDDVAVDEVRALLQDSVDLRMVADVPVGVFLSGGIDSSLVTALMRSHSSGRVRSFSIGFEESGYDESGPARAVAQELGTDHTEYRLGAREALELIPKLASIYDEPFGDPSQIPTHLVSRLARQHVTVALSGDGGDELFGGYTRYSWGPALWNRVHRIPRQIRLASHLILNKLPTATAAAITGRLAGASGEKNLEEKYIKALHGLRAESEGQWYRLLRRRWVGQSERSEAIQTDSDTLQWHPMGALAESMMLADAASYLPDDILVKVDRASMAVGLEAREPLLDHRLFALAWRLPLALRVEGARGKPILRKILTEYLPLSLIERPKAGFNLPIGAWLRGPLRDWAESKLGSFKAQHNELMDSKMVDRSWNDHLRGRGAHFLAIWDLLMFQAWREANHA